MLNQANTLPQKMRAKHVAKEFSIGLSTIWRYVKEGKLKVTKITDGVTVFDRQEVEAFFSGKSNREVSQ